MADITREEIGARLEAAESRTEARFTELSFKIDRLASETSANGQALQSFQREVREEFREVRAEVRADNRNTRATIVITLVASLLAFAGAMWTAQANLLAAFQAGLAKQAAASAPLTLERKSAVADAR